MMLRPEIVVDKAKRVKYVTRCAAKVRAVEVRDEHGRYKLDFCVLCIRSWCHGRRPIVCDGAY